MTPAGPSRRRDEPVGVLPLNLGGPDSLDAVEPFLVNPHASP
jgi:protoheme ferro-lyase